MSRVLFPSVRDLSVVPPVINAINYLSTFENVSVFSYYINKNQFDSAVQLHAVSAKPYPGTKIPRQFAKLKSWIKFYSFLFKKSKEYDFIWMGVWDYAVMVPVLKLAGYKGKVIFQLNELEFNQFKYCKRADYVIVPDENRGWIAYFIAKLKSKPILLPNIPFLPASLSFSRETELSKIRAAHADKGVKILLYQGHIDYRKRCIRELLEAVALLPGHIVLVIMPANYSNTQVLEQIKKDSKELAITERVYLINSVKAPEHLMTVQQADIGIGLYRPTSLNQIYAAPNRLYEFTKFGIPLVLPNFPAFKSLSIKYPFAINTADPESADDIASSIMAILEASNYNQGRINAKKFTDTEGRYEAAFKDCWSKISKN